MLWLMYKGKSREAIAVEMHITGKAIAKRITRMLSREGCDSALQLVCRYLDEYCGVGDPWGYYAETDDETVIFSGGAQDGKCPEPDADKGQPTRSRHATA